MNYILHLDTSSSSGKVLLSVQGNICQARTLEDSKEQSAQINVLIQKVLADEHICLQQVAAISVCNGPGSYTGLRVGLSTAKGLAFAHDMPLILHHKLKLSGLSYLGQYPDLFVLLHARAQEVFGCLFLEGKLYIEPRHFFAEEARHIISEYRGIHLLGDHLSAVLPVSGHVPHTIVDEKEIYHDEVWVRESERRYAQKEFDDLAYSEPFYLKSAFTTQQKK